MSSTGPSMMPQNEVDKIRLLQRAVESLQGKDSGDVVSLAAVAALAKLKSNGNGNGSVYRHIVEGVMVVLLAGSIIGGISMYRDIGVLYDKVSKCQTTSP